MRGLPVGGPPDVAYERTRPMPEVNRVLGCRACVPEYGSTVGQQLAPGATLLGRDHRETSSKGGRGVAHSVHQEASVGEILAASRLQEEASVGLPRTRAPAVGGRGCPGPLQKPRLGR